jgi:E3 ubiquitin-protein ligase MYCBP2
MLIDQLKLNLGEHNKILNDKNHRFYKKPKSLAMAIFAVYPCHKCKKPFIGGKVNCEVGQNDQVEAQDPNAESKFICPDCSNIKKCAIHGSKFMQFKCKFCCDVAVWFCWGTTHFCDPCHKK